MRLTYEYYEKEENEPFGTQPICGYEQALGSCPSIAEIQHRQGLPEDIIHQLKCV